MSWFCDSKYPRPEGNHNYTTVLGFIFVSVCKGWRGIIVIFINLDVEAPSWYMLLSVRYTQDLVALFLISKGIVCACMVNTNTMSPQKQAGNLLLYGSRVLKSCVKCWAGLKMDNKSSERVQRISIFIGSVIQGSLHAFKLPLSKLNNTPMWQTNVNLPTLQMAEQRYNEAH